MGRHWISNESERTLMNVTPASQHRAWEKYGEQVYADDNYQSYELVTMQQLQLEERLMMQKCNICEGVLQPISTNQGCRLARSLRMAPVEMETLHYKLVKKKCGDVSQIRHKDSWQREIAIPNRKQKPWLSNWEPYSKQTGTALHHNNGQGSTDRQTTVRRPRRPWLAS